MPHSMLITDRSELKRFYACHRVWQGIPGIARTKKGRTFISFYSGNIKETYGNYALVLKSDSNTDFGEPIAAAEKPGEFRCFDPVLWIDPLDRLWFIWNVMPGEEVFASICDDPDADELVWGEEFCIGRGIMMNKPLVLACGAWLFPIAVWKTDIYYDFRKSALRDDEVAGSYVYRTDDCGKTFRKLGYADLRNRSFDEHMVMEKTNGALWMLVRLKNGIGESYSYDGGNTWSKGQETSLGGPSSRFFLKKLKSGRVLLINHHNFTKRNNLTAFLSEDDGNTFPYTLLLDERGAVSYPDAVECEDGYLYIVYDRERGCFKSSLAEAYDSAREILTAKITEEDILRGEVVSEGSFLKNVVCKLGELAEGDPDPYTMPPADNGEFARQLLESRDPDPIGKIFAAYPLNCISACDFDAKKMDTMINRFKESGGTDEALLTEIIDYVREVPQKQNDPYPVIEAIKTYLKEHLAEDIPLSTVAEQMHINVYYLSHLFKAVTGATMIEYRNELRLAKAKELLVNTDKSILLIAEGVGFSSSAYFTEFFSKTEKIPPSEYRKQHRR